MATSANTPTSSSVSPKIIIASVTILSVLFLITLVGVVIIVVRAYKKRRRFRTGGRLADEEDSCVRDGRGWDRHVRNGRLTRQPHSPIPPPPVRRTTEFRRAQYRTAEPLLPPEPIFRRNSRPLSWDARDIVGQGFRKSRRASNAGVERVVTMGRGYTVRHADEKSTGSSVQVAEIALGNGFGHTPTSSISKIERLTGNTLSNDLYAERVSGATDTSRLEDIATKAPMKEVKRFSYPLQAQRSPEPRARRSADELKLQTGAPGLQVQRSPTVSTSTSQEDVSPVSSTSNQSSIVNALSAPPAVPAAFVDAYPNVVALTQANAKAPASNRRSRRLSMEKNVNATKHIASQFSATKQRSRSPQPGLPSSRTMGPASALLGSSVGFDRKDSSDTTASTSFGKFAVAGLDRQGSNKSDISKVSSLSSLPGAATSPTDTLGHRRSWSGRSVLLLDDNGGILRPVQSRRRPAPIPPPPRLPTIAATPSPLSSSPSAVSARLAPERARVTAFGPILPTVSTTEHLSPAKQSKNPSPERLDTTSLARSTSNSKASVLSMPSTISSFNTVLGGEANAPIIGGLSPTPAPRPSTQPQASDENLQSTGGEQRKSMASTVLTDTSSANLTEEELQAEMARVRERARRASEERKSKRRRDEQRELDAQNQRV